MVANAGNLCYTDTVLIKKAGRVYGHMQVAVGDILTMKKPHPCGNNRFLVLRIGMDFKIRCLGCNHEVMLPRAKVEKNIKRITSPEET